MNELYITEIFSSIQGESTHAGRLCVFVRLAGCNLRCSYCDTDYSLEFGKGTKMSLDEIVADVKERGITLVELTGGEPLAQKGTPELCRMLIDEGCEVLIETNGALDISVLPNGVKRIMDWKTPSSGESDKMLPANISLLTDDDEVKFVVASEDDYCWALSEIKKYDLGAKCGDILFSPVFEQIKPADIVDWIVRDKPPARFQLQMHKFIWHPDERGV